MDETRVWPNGVVEKAPPNRHEEDLHNRYVLLHLAWSYWSWTKRIWKNK